VRHSVRSDKGFAKGAHPTRSAERLPLQGFFAKRKSGGARVIFLEGELARAFNDDAEIEKALRAYLRERGRKTA
jgi:hypothetical protein